MQDHNSTGGLDVQSLRRWAMSQKPPSTRKSIPTPQSDLAQNLIEGPSQHLPGAYRYSGCSSCRRSR